MKHIAIIITGKVQGVWYRASAKAKADELGLKGIARNEADGSVYIEAEGSAEKLFQLILWCHNGPPGARVEKVTTTDGEVKGHKDFRIER